MKKKNLLFIFTLTAVIIITTALAMANPGGDSNQDEGVKVIRTYYNVSIIIKDHTEAQNTLCNIVKQYGGNLTNFNFNLQNNSGNASVQINPEKVNSFLKELEQMGEIESSNLSTSDYTNSYYEYKRKLYAYEKFYGMYQDVIAQSDLSKEDKRFLDGEISQLINSQINSMRSSMESYAQYDNYSEISIQLRYGDNYQPGTTNNTPQEDMVIIKKDLRDTPETKASADRNFYLMTIVVFILFLTNIIVTYCLLKNRKKDQSPYTS